ncbi:UDP-glucose flavonoid 3-O-glucosyltransferase 6-like [Neltuma alba]|uniref:UDP-glucose flavonoid 3-O-glucosyltransferase 6-like n=1 Tax=Neltuma alba TaxID=207710 RepID=UPI0010A3FC7C|nr:UDP-glucose flavonoid 3-O-glucosyltransferase 6-like [Prosopis alba]
MIKKSQLVFVPLPAIGHMVSTIEFAKLLIKHNEHLSITVLLIQAPFDSAVHSYTHSLTSSLSVPERLRFILLPTHRDPHANSDQSSHPASFIERLIESHKPSIREAVSNLKSGPDAIRLAGFVVDMFCTSMIEVANEFGVPTMVFFAASAAFLGFILHIHAIRDRENVDTTALNFKESGTQFAIPSFANLVPASVFPTAVLEKEWDSFFFNRAKELRKVKCIIVNTFEELESHAVQSFSNGDLPKVYPVGPILSLGEDRFSKMVQEGSDVLAWLNDQPPSSVLFMCFGSRGYFEDGDQVREIARALERSGVHFLWSLRKPPPDTVTAPGVYAYPDLAEVLPEGFLERTAGTGRVIGWAPQAQILVHEAVGGFVSHCGWNSVLESIYYGVPIATWPLFADQEMNAFEVVRELKLGVEVSLDYRMGFENRGKSGVVSAERIEKGMKEVMEEESELRKKLKEMSQLSRKAVMEGGSSYTYLGRFIDEDVLN